MKFISVTGIDRSGKTTLLQAFNEATNFVHMTVDRDPSTVMFFADLMHRVKGRKRYHQNYKQVINYKFVPDLAVYLFADPEDIQYRFDVTNEPALIGDLNFKYHMQLMEDYFNKAGYLNTIKLNTSILTPQECANRMVTQLGVK